LQEYRKQNDWMFVKGIVIKVSGIAYSCV
jgi:hypothetical protein